MRFPAAIHIDENSSKDLQCYVCFFSCISMSINHLMVNASRELGARCVYLCVQICYFHSPKLTRIYQQVDYYISHRLSLAIGVAQMSPLPKRREQQLTIFTTVQRSRIEHFIDGIARHIQSMIKHFIAIWYENAGETTAVGKIYWAKAQWRQIFMIIVVERKKEVKKIGYQRRIPFGRVVGAKKNENRKRNAANETKRSRKLEHKNAYIWHSRRLNTTM